MGISRQSVIVRGPALVEFRWPEPGTGEAAGTVVTTSYAVKSKGDIVLTPEIQAFGIECSELGEVEQRRQEIMLTLKFQPAGVVDATSLALFWPHLDKLPGESLASHQVYEDPVTTSPTYEELVPYDMEVKIWDRAGAVKDIVLKNCYVTKMPDIDLSAVQTQIGEVEIRALLPDGLDWAEFARMSFPSAKPRTPWPAGVDTANIPTVSPTVAFGELSDLKTKDGVKISFDMQTQDETEDETGVYDITLVSLNAKASFIPVAGADQYTLLRTYLAAEAGARGSAIARHAFSATSNAPGGLAVTIPNAALLTAPLTWGRQAGRFDRLEVQGLRNGSGTDPTVSIVPEEETSGT